MASGTINRDTTLTANGGAFAASRVAGTRAITVTSSIKPSSYMQKDDTKSGKLHLKSILAAIAPWLVILGLIYIAFYTHPGELGEIVQPSPISSADHFYGAAKAGG